jgi:hypothetical protein
MLCNEIRIANSICAYIRAMFGTRKNYNATINPADQRREKSMKETIAAISIAVIGSLACPVFLTAAEEKEETVKMSDLPAAVQTTIKDKAGSNEIVKIEKKTEEGKTVYEAVVNKKGKQLAIEVDANGKFLKQYKEGKEKEQGEKY